MKGRQSHRSNIQQEGNGDGIWRRNTNYKKAAGPGVIISADADTEEER